MGEDKSTHILEMKRQREGLRTANTDRERQKHPPTRNEETKEVLRTANMDEGGQRHTHSRDKETKGGLRTAKTDG